MHVDTLRADYLENYGAADRHCGRVAMNREFWSGRRVLVTGHTVQGPLARFSAQGYGICPATDRMYHCGEEIEIRT